MTRLITIATAAAALGCFPPVLYTRPGATRMDWANDHQFCELYAQRMNENDTWSKGFTHNMIVRQCLEERGWQRERQ